MDTLQKDEIRKMVGDKDHVIMSDGLDIDLGEFSPVEQFLEINGSRLICSTSRAKSPEGRLQAWEFDLEVPGLSLSDLVDINTITYWHGKLQFEVSPCFEIKNLELAPIITITANRIFTNNE